MVSTSGRFVNRILIFPAQGLHARPSGVRRPLRVPSGTVPPRRKAGLVCPGLYPVYFRFRTKVRRVAVALVCSSDSMYGRVTHMDYYRICPGRHFALASLFINVASVLHGFNVTPPLDADGLLIAIQHSQTAGLVSCVPFRVGSGARSDIGNLCFAVTRKTVGVLLNPGRPRPQH